MKNEYILFYSMFLFFFFSILTIIYVYSIWNLNVKIITFIYFFGGITSSIYWLKAFSTFSFLEIDIELVISCSCFSI